MLAGQRAHTKATKTHQGKHQQNSSSMHQRGSPGKKPHRGSHAHQWKSPCKQAAATWQLTHKRQGSVATHTQHTQQHGSPREHTAAQQLAGNSLGSMATRGQQHGNSQATAPQPKHLHATAPQLACNSTATRMQQLRSPHTRMQQHGNMRATARQHASNSVATRVQQHSNNHTTAWQHACNSMATCTQ